MSEWTDGLATTLGVSPLTPDDEDALLHVSRNIAHRFERKDTPASAYLMGVSAGMRIAEGAEPATALHAVLAEVGEQLPPAAALGP